MQDAWRAYLELAMGLTEAPRKKAQDAVMRVVGQGGATAAQIQMLAEELVATGVANRESLTKLVRFEVDRALGAVGLATADEVAELTRRVRDLERQLREARTATEATDTRFEPDAPQPTDTPHTSAAPPKPAPSTSAPPPAAAPAEASPTAGAPSKAVAKKAAKKAVAKKTAKKAVATKPPATVARTPADETDPARSGKKNAGPRATDS
ncbi:phasin family protein [Micromonospora sp. DT31]|uniref:phasin family protein n=1 Tax=Micromonospora sp. DT31 TaxID=3393434 RepID=UPI003CEF334B